MTLFVSACSHRPMNIDDLAEVTRFVQTPEELFFCFPKASWPLTIGQLAAATAERRHSTVALLDGRPAGFANFYQWQHGDSCSLGNLMVAPWARGRGVAQYLVTAMEQQARTHYKARRLQVNCFNSNTAGLLLYARLGYSVQGISERRDLQQGKIALLELSKALPPLTPVSVD